MLRFLLHKNILRYVHENVNLIASSPKRPLSHKSMSLPGVAITTLHPLPRSLIWELTSAPPYTTHTLTCERYRNFGKS